MMAELKIVNEDVPKPKTIDLRDVLLLTVARQLRKQMTFQPSTTADDLRAMDAALAPFEEVQS